MSEEKERPNAASEQSVKKQTDVVRRIKERQLGDIRTVLSSKEGRRFCWRLLEHCNVFASIWRPSAEIHHLAGKQDVGHHLMRIIEESDPKAFVLMIRENQEDKIT